MSLPEDMDRTYDRIIDRINNSPKPQRELARRALMWIAYAKRPLSESELTCAIAMESNTRSVEELDSMTPTVGTVIALCSSLIARDNGDIRFVHFSVQEYILSKSRDATITSITALDMAPDRAQLEISTMCITFGLYCWSPNGGCYRYPKFSYYALENWMWHVRAVDGINDELLILILNFFELGPFFRLTFQYSSPPGWSHLPEPHTKFSPSTAALIFDLRLASDHLRTTNDGLLDYPDEKYAMHFAARQNSAKAIERLCERGFSVSELDKDQRTAMYYATDITTYRALLNHGADVNAHNGRAITEATRTGSLELVTFLVANGANYNLSLALSHAIFSDKLEIARVLLDGGADANGDLPQGGTPLQAAAGYGLTSMVQLLIDRGADVNAAGDYHASALHAAAWRGIDSSVELLLDRGADVNARGRFYGSALAVAIDEGNHTTVQILLDRGAVMK